MRKLLLGLVVVAFGPGLVAAADPSHAVQTLAWEFVLPCHDGTVVSSGPVIELPSGTYAYTVKGGCLYGVDQSRSYSTTVGTPCSDPTVGPLPCANTTLANIPMPACQLLTEGMTADGCARVVQPTPCGLSVVINGACVSNTGVGPLVHGGGPMTAQFVDSFYDDNIGAFTVTVVWTPL